MWMTAAAGKPWFRHGDRKNAVNMWYWAAPSVEPEDGERTLLMDAAGPSSPPVPRQDSSALSARGAWKNGRWQVVFKRAMETEAAPDLQISEGRYIPIAFANWDGLAGAENKAVLYGAPPAAGLLAGFLFLIAARRQRKRYRG
jgi:DMSO reductase family type II enzyme heme b subunit